MIAMPAKLKKKWVKALRSGEYGQAEGVLCDGKGNFCCLGVLEHVAMNGEVEVDTEYEDGFRDMPTDIFLKYANIKVTAESEPFWCDEREKVIGKLDLVGLASLNDNGLDFEQLADAIEEKVRTY